MKWTVLMLALLLGACSQVEMYEKGVVEPKVDEAYDSLVQRWCHMPPDIQKRAIERKTVTPRSLTDNCDTWRAIRDAMIGEVIGE